MAYYITQACIGTKDASCVEVCPVDCIHPRPEAPDFGTHEMLHIDPQTCIDCGLCVDECPVSAIYAPERLPVKFEHFIARNAAYFQTDE